jgi:hypothetical protein
MTVQPLPEDATSWAHIYADLRAEVVENTKFESGSNFKYESALRLRVLHKVQKFIVGKEAKWIKELYIPKTQQRETKTAIEGAHFAGLLKIVRRSGKLSTSDFMDAGCFSTFLSLLSLIEHRNIGEAESESSAVTYCSPPIAKRTRSHQVPPGLPQTPTPPTRLKNTSLEEDTPEPPQTPTALINLKNMSLEEDTPETPESPEEPPSGVGSVAKYEDAEVNVRDEQTVNQCLINLMLPITWPLGISGNIDPQRKAFTFVLDGKQWYEARVDGIVTHKDRPTDVVGFLEVKRGRRTHWVRLQEAAQMVAFIKMESAAQDSEDWVGKRCVASACCFALLIQSFSHWLVSMCANDMFITIARYERPYLEFLATMPKWGGDTSGLKKDAFLHMTEYGPFKLRTYYGLVAALEHLYVLLSEA